MNKIFRKLPCLIVSFSVLAFLVVLPGLTYAALHGIAGLKGCEACKEPGQTTDCEIQAAYVDQYGDTTRIDSAKDIIASAGGDVTVPPSGNLPIVAIEGNTTCAVAGTLPCLIGPAGSTLNGLPGNGAAGSVTFRSNAYVIDALDPNPLGNSGNIGYSDLCDAPGTSGCNPLSQFVTAGASTIVCKQDANLCTTEGCDEAGQCVTGPTTTCAPDADLCTTEACVPASGLCESGPTTTCAPDADLCTTEACVPATGLCGSVLTTTCEQDANLCTTEDCIPATGECGTVSTVSCADAGLPDVCCDPIDGECKADPNLDPSCGEIVEICRTPGFWGTHAGTEKDRSQNITQAVIDAGGGCLEICGEAITNTALNDASSSVEAICVPVKDQQTRQLARQLTAAALNCIMSNGSADCIGVSIEEVFNACNTACADGETTVVIDSETVDCIGAIDDYNNGLTNDCHSQPLCNDGLCFEPPGPAGSSKECNDANKSPCTVIQPNEDSCSTDSHPESCSPPCAHDVCVTGVALDSACSECVALVCGSDSWCCTFSWDSICVDEAQDWCGVVCDD